MEFPRPQRRTILFDALLAAILAVALVGTRKCFESNTQSRRWIKFKFATYGSIESILASKPIPQKVAIAFVDLGEFKIERIQGVQRDEGATRDKRLK